MVNRFPDRTTADLVHCSTSVPRQGNRANTPPTMNVGNSVNRFSQRQPLPHSRRELGSSGGVFVTTGRSCIATGANSPHRTSPTSLQSSGSLTARTPARDSRSSILKLPDIRRPRSARDSPDADPRQTAQNHNVNANQGSSSSLRPGSGKNGKPAGAGSRNW